jgi:uncharacterized protein YicC (UPF0701 family)
MTAKQMTEEQMVGLVRNALLVAGQEMGNGDQWPVIKDTIHKISKDFENLKTERAVDEELKVHLYEQLQGMETSLPECSPRMQAILAPKVRELREVCDAYFSDIDKTAVLYDDSRLPEHIKRMNAIISTLEDSND